MLDNFLHFSTRRYFQHRDLRRDYTPSLTLNIADSVHPSLSSAAIMLEKSVLRLDMAVEAAMTQFGHDVAVKEVELMRLSQAATETYAMTSALARANRSYCQGHAHGEHEVDLACASIFDSSRKVMNLTELVSFGFYSSSDFFTRRVSEYMYEKGGYIAEHPISRNIW